MINSTLVSPSTHPRELIKSREYRNSIIEKVERIFNQLANPNPSTVTLLQQEANRVKDELIWIIDLNLKHLSREFCTPSANPKTEKSRYDYNDITQFHGQADWAPSSSLFSTCYDTHSTSTFADNTSVNSDLEHDDLNERQQQILQGLNIYANDENHLPPFASSFSSSSVSNNRQHTVKSSDQQQTNNNSMAGTNKTSGKKSSKRPISKINPESTTLNSASLTTHTHHQHQHNNNNNNNNRSSSTSSNATTTTSTKNNGEATTSTTNSSCTTGGNATPSTTSSNSSSLQSNHHIHLSQQQHNCNNNSKESSSNFSHSSASSDLQQQQHYPPRHYHNNSPPPNVASGLHSLHSVSSPHKNVLTANNVTASSSSLISSSVLNSDFSSHHHHHHHSRTSRTTTNGLHPTLTDDNTHSGGGTPPSLLHHHSMHNNQTRHHLLQQQHHSSHSTSEQQTQHSLTQDQALQQPISTDPFSQNTPPSSNLNTNSYHSKITTTETTLSSVPFSQISKPPTTLMNNQTLSQSRPPCSKQSRAPTSLTQSFENLSLAVGSGNQDKYSNVHHENSILHHLLPSEQDYGLSELSSHLTTHRNHHHHRNKHHDSSSSSQQQTQQQQQLSSSPLQVGGSLITTSQQKQHHKNISKQNLHTHNNNQTNNLNHHGSSNVKQINKTAAAIITNSNIHSHHPNNNMLLLGIGGERKIKHHITAGQNNKITTSAISNLNISSRMNSLVENDSSNKNVLIKPPSKTISSSNNSSPFSFDYVVSSSSPSSSSSHLQQQQQQQHVISSSNLNSNNPNNQKRNNNNQNQQKNHHHKTNLDYNIGQQHQQPPPSPIQQQHTRPPPSSSLKNSNSQPFRQQQQQHPASFTTIGDQFTQNEHVPHQAPHLANKTTNTTKSRYDDENKNVSWLKVAKKGEPNLNNSPHDPYRPLHKSSRTNFASKPKQNAIVHNHHPSSTLKKHTKRTSDKTNLPRKPPSEDQLRRRIFISNLPSDFTEGAIRSELESTCGPIAHTLWFASRTDGKFYGSGLITFSTPNGAAKALTLNGTSMFGRTIRIEPSRCPDPVKKKPPGCQTIYLNNLSKNITDIQLRQIFQLCGDMKSIRVLDRPNKNTNVAFIEFVESDSTTVALEHHGKVIDGYPLHVDYQRNK